MGKKLIIAEKPSVAVKIAASLDNIQPSNGYFENELYIVTFAFGHLFELKSIEQYLGCEKAKWTLEQLPFFPKKFEYILRNEGEVRKQYNIIKKLYKRKDVERIINAGDPDREGSVIILNIIHGLEKETKIKKPVERVWLTATTPEFIKKALDNLKNEEFYGHLYEEGLARTYADWLWGINFTRFVTLKAGDFFPVGRVLIPIVKFVYDRDECIRKFKKETYYEIDAIVKKDGYKLKSKIKGIKFPEENKKEGQELCKMLSGADAVVKKVEINNVTKFPERLFSLDTLQNKMSRDFKYSSAETLKVAQSLYGKGYITYPRTNTEYLATAEKSSVNDILQKISMEEEILLVLKENKRIFDDSKIEGHTALIITGKDPVKLSEEEENVYRTIKNRFISNFLNEKTVLQEKLVEIKIGEYVIELRGTSILQSGFLKYEPIRSEKFLPHFTEGEVIEDFELQLVEKSTVPPGHVNEIELNTFLKNPFKRGEVESSDEEDYKNMLLGCEIGTVATRAGIIENALRYEYLNKENNVFYITEKGITLIHILMQLGINMEKSKTVEFGMDLKKVYKNRITLNDVVEKTKQDIVGVIGKTQPVKIGNCPICNDSALSGEKKYYCSNKKCDFTIWKSIAKKELPEKQVKKLLKKGKTALIKGFHKRTGGT